MAFDKVVDSSKLDAAMKATADKIRSESKTSSNIAWDESKGFADSIKTQTKTATPSTNLQAIRPDEGYVGLSQVNVEAIQSVAQATPSISVSSTGLITASAAQSAGYVAEGTKSATKQLSTQAKKTVTPSSSAQTAVAAGKYTTGAVTVAAIPSTYKRVATGTFTTGTNSNLKKNPVTVSGLGFTPSRVILWLSTVDHVNAWDEIVCADWDGTNTKVTYVLDTGAECDECGNPNLHMMTETNKMEAGNTISMSVGNGYFRLSSDKGGLASYMYYVGIASSSTYSYIAFA